MKYKNSVYRTFALLSQVGISMIVPILLCAWLGSYLEDKFSIPVFIPLIINRLSFLRKLSLKFPAVTL